MSELQSMDKDSSNGKLSSKTEATQVKKQRKTCGIPVVKSLSDMPLLKYEARVEQQPTEWERMKNYDFFSPVPDGSRLMQKVTRSKSLDLQTRETLPTTYGQAYIVHLKASPSTDKLDF